MDKLQVSMWIALNVEVEQVSVNHQPLHKFIEISAVYQSI